MTAETTAGKTLLIVEDNPATRESLAGVLETEGYRVIMAKNGREALDRLQSGPAPDLILLDMLMPVMDGWHFLGELKRSVSRIRSIPIVITTIGITSREWALDHGAAGFVQKPIEVQPLLEEIRRCC